MKHATPFQVFILVTAFTVVSSPSALGESREEKIQREAVQGRAFMETCERAAEAISDLNLSPIPIKEIRGPMLFRFSDEDDRIEVGKFVQKNGDGSWKVEPKYKYGTLEFGFVENGKVSGYLALDILGGTAKIKNITLSPNADASKVIQAMLKQVKDIVTNHQPTRLQVFAWELKPYTRDLGFKVVGTTPGKYGEEKFIIERQPEKGVGYLQATQIELTPGSQALKSQLELHGFRPSKDRPNLYTLPYTPK